MCRSRAAQPAAKKWAVSLVVVVLHGSCLSCDVVW